MADIVERLIKGNPYTASFGGLWKSEGQAHLPLRVRRMGSWRPGVRTIMDVLR